MTEGDESLEKYSIVWNKVSANIKKNNLIASLPIKKIL